MLSLRHRALLGGAVSGAVSIAIGTFALNSYIDGKVLERFDRSLQERHTQLIVGLSATTQDPNALRDLIVDPVYDTPYSGRYWQVRANDGDIFTSASLFDATLPAPGGAGDTLRIWNTLGPENEPVRSAFQRIGFEDGTFWDVSVAESRSELSKDRKETRRSLLLAFAFVAAIGIVGSVLVMSMVLGPLRKLREDVAKRWDDDEELKQADYPEEVSPLVGDINQLLDRNREIVSGARRQAADLAHALKTPTAILRNELALLSEDDVKSEKAQEALERIEAQLSRSLARMRAANTAELTHSRTDLSHSVARFSRIFISMAERDGKSFVADIAPDLSVRMDAQDIEEVIGNLLDNALKWSRNTLGISVRSSGDQIEMLIEDDGPGIPEEMRSEVLQTGGRLDTSKPGTGLGLTIALDLLKAYGARLEFEQSERLGGLAVRIVLPSEIVRSTLARP